MMGILEIGDQPDEFNIVGEFSSDQAHTQCSSGGTAGSEQAVIRLQGNYLSSE